jgi:catechol 2,3-dioxygenase-like lactoylglutathione lyase family enzyme
MKQEIGQISILVKDYDEAIEFYTQKLNFELLEDTARSETKRWVRVRPKGSEGCGLLLAKAKNERELQSVGNQAGGRVFLFLYTDNMERDYANLITNNVKIIRALSTEDFGKVCVFTDLYGNLWDFIEPK